VQVERPGVSVADQALRIFVDYLALSYHEARNVRHLIRAGHTEPGPYAHILQLSRHREEAWRQLQPLRSMAHLCESAKAAEELFRRRFGLCLEDLANLFANPGWKDSSRGGNQWAYVVRDLIELRQALSVQELDTLSTLLESIPRMPHNNGILSSKLRRLDGAL